ncbi:MAG: 2-phosphosulfolactate phosphatase [Solobacterium sp.]|nr:2-phosphosulfolactate phosphatase [Solobacterium sp.]
MKVEILHLLEGAAKAKGTVVVIDVFRAFSLECWMYARGCSKVIPVATEEDSFALHRKHPDYVLAGERNGIRIKGFDYGNSPSEFEHLDLHGKTVIHTTSAGVQGLAAVSGADEILTGALVNAAATAEYIRQKDPACVSLVAMGWNGLRDTEEDVLCAQYLRSLLAGSPMGDIRQKALELRYTEGKKFFDPANAGVFPERDFWLCTEPDLFAGVIRVSGTRDDLTTEWIPVKMK